MKITTKTSGVAEINQSELFEIVKDWIKRNKGLDVVKLQYPEGGVKKIVAVIEGSIDQGAKPLGREIKEPKKVNAAEGFTHKWEGLYSAIGEVLDEQRKRRKTFITYEDLLAEILELENNRGQKLFVKGNEKLPMSVLRHRLAPSQLVRQATGQPNLRGVENDKKNKGLKFS